jgi:hypothetical protein
VHGVASLIVDGAWRVEARTADRALAYALDGLLADPGART